ncbi:MAG TPA: ATP-binding protein [Streptosporangiaceae bacterium]|jgi:anti-sigma regulatory factor (Ser/Thr protein kinase)|nr:ATP-binding protein [Streptosporangiaceae bacterium]
MSGAVPGSKPYQDRLLADRASAGITGPRLTEQVTADIASHSSDRQVGTRVRIPSLTDSHGNDFADQWPLRSGLELGALPSAVPCARLHARQKLREWQLTSLSDSTELVVCELITNAIQIPDAGTQDAPVRLWLLADRTQIVVLVWDFSPLPPVRITGSETDENGRGLLMVEAVSERWGHLPAGNGGKFVWAIVR